MYDCIVLGIGPAGISVSIYLKRSRKKVLAIGKKDWPLAKSKVIENYYGFSKPVTGEFLLNEGVNQAVNLDVDISYGEALSVEIIEKGFKITADTGVFETKAVAIATGYRQEKLDIENIDRFTGSGVSYCVICDGFFYTDKKVGVIGNSKYALHEAKLLKNYTDDVNFFTNGNKLHEIEYKDLSDFNVVEEKVEKVYGNEFVEGIILSNGKEISADGIFVAGTQAGGSDFARSLGIYLDRGYIVTDNKQRTNIPGIYAAGDCTGGFKQIATAVGQGAIAAKSILDELKEE